MNWTNTEMKPKIPQKTNRKAQIWNFIKSKLLHKHIYAFRNIPNFATLHFSSSNLPQILVFILSDVRRAIYIGSRKNLVIFLLKTHYEIRITTLTVRQIKHSFINFFFHWNTWICTVNLIYCLVCSFFGFYEKIVRVLGIPNYMIK